MKNKTLKTAILTPFLVTIFVLSVFVAAAGFYVIKNNIIERAQEQVTHNLKAARIVYKGELDAIANLFAIMPLDAELELTKEKIGLDYICRVKARDIENLKNEIAAKAFLSGTPSGGTRIISEEELVLMGEQFYKKVVMHTVSTPKSRPAPDGLLKEAMAIEYACPVFGENGGIEEVIYGGKIINRNFELVDKIFNLVFENKFYNGKPAGTVTIFQGDVRVATNVLDKNKKRAVGTRVSEIVYKKVIEEGMPWRARAFVVTDWYLTAYEPIKDIKGNIIGMLYVGMLEEPYRDMTRNILLVFIGIILFITALAVAFSFILASQISKPIENILEGTAGISRGNLEHRVKADTSVRELNKLAISFNEMAQKLSRSYEEIKSYNIDLAALNKRYLNLVSFVSHELKSILSSTVLNAYSMRDGFLGMVNFKQQKALDSIVRNLDYLSSTVKNFLDLSRIEKGEMTVTKMLLNLKEDIFDVALDDFSRQIAEKDMTVANNIKPGILISVDADLMRIVVNNLLSNAVKYGRVHGNIIIDAEEKNGRTRIEIYNDGTAVTDEQKQKLFRRFSRLETAETKNIKGTGLGLFITKEIIEKHGGTIKLQVKPSGNSFVVMLN